MIKTTIQIAREAIERDLGNAIDNLTRAELTRDRNPQWVSGNGESIEAVVRGYRKHVLELQLALLNLEE